ncbi:hypothetical protein ACN42_g11538 [Penicillium freii]|uniref:Uncharacterized protein n=1 Tax=Penicillium freii TaxID=48697 RepID=A0A101M832_PENFR|nr:hypothetical protein ACN42_g11538 [Penicillium freii]
MALLVCTQSSTYDHRVWKTGLPVRSAVLKPHAGELVVGWVTTSESSLLHVFFFFIFHLASPSGVATPHNSYSSCPLAIIPLHRTRRTMITTTCYNLPLDWRVTNSSKKTTISEHNAQIVQAPIYIMRDMTEHDSKNPHAQLGDSGWMQYHVLARFKIAPHPFHALIQVLKQPEKEIPRVQFIIEEIANTETKKMNLDKMEQYCKNLQTVAERDTGTINAAQSVSVFG